jgi:HK97 family phage prohead protease
MNGFGEPGPGEFSGYGSVYNVTDLAGDIVAPGSFVNLPDFRRSGVILWTHDTARPVAVPLDVRDDGVGLFLRARLHDTADGVMAGTILRERSAAGMMFGLSIGYSILKSHSEGKNRILDALYLHEVSLVALPANPRAGVRSIKLGPPNERSMARTSRNDPALAEFVRMLEHDARRLGVAV